MATQQIINIGVLPNDGVGDPLRTAFSKINNNFTELFSTDFTTAEAFTVGNMPGQVIFEIAAASFTQGHFQINSSNPSSTDSQNITLVAAKSNSGTSVKFTGFGTIFDGNPVTRYDMDISGGNVRILCNPMTTALLNHFIAFQITYTGPVSVGVDIALDGYPTDSFMTTEDGFILATEQ